MAIYLHVLEVLYETCNHAMESGCSSVKQIHFLDRTITIYCSYCFNLFFLSYRTTRSCQLLLVLPGLQTEPNFRYSALPNQWTSTPTQHGLSVCQQDLALYHNFCSRLSLEPRQLPDRFCYRDQGSNRPECQAM